MTVTERVLTVVSIAVGVAVAGIQTFWRRK